MYLEASQALSSHQGTRIKLQENSSKGVFVQAPSPPSPQPFWACAEREGGEGELILDRWLGNVRDFLQPENLDIFKMKYLNK